MAHHSKFLSVNLNKSYGKSYSDVSYGNDRPRSANGGGGMVVLSRPRSSSGSNLHKSAQKLAVPPPVNLPSLRKEHERLDPAFSKPSSGHGGSGMGIGNSSSMSWTKPSLQIQDFSDKDGVSRSVTTVEKRGFESGFQRQGSGEKTVILRGEDFPSLNATSNYFVKQKQKQVRENSDGLADRYELNSPKLKNVQGSEGGSNPNRNLNSLEPSRRGGGDFPGPLPLMKLKHNSDWDDDERDRNHVDHVDHYGGGNSLPRDSYVKDFKKEDRNFSSWRAPVESNREISSARAMHVDKDHFGHRNSGLSRGTSKESSHDRLSYGDKKEIGNSFIADGRAEVSNNWQRGKNFTNSAITIKGFSANDPVQNFNKEKSISNFSRSYAEEASWGEKDSFSSDSMIDLKAKMVRKKKEAIKHTDIFDPARESFEAELARVQQLQEQERQRLMEEQARIMEIARREAEERERIAREEEERRRLLEEEAREAAWRAEQEKLESARRAEELRIARLEDKKKFLMEEERRKEAARQKLLELEAKIASRQTEANDNDRVRERNSSRESDLAKCEKTETMVEHLAGSPAYDSSAMNRLSEAGFRPHTSNVENHSFGRHGKTEYNGGSSMKFQDYDSGYLVSRQDRSLRTKQFHDIHGSKPVTAPFKRGMSGDQAQTGRGWDQNRDFDQFNGSSSIDARIGGWDHGHFDGSQLESYLERSFQNSDVDDKASFSRVRQTIRQPRVPPPPSVSSSIRKNPRGSASVGRSSSLSVHVDAMMNHEGMEEESDVQNSYHQRIIEPGAEPRMPELVEEPAYSLMQTEEKNSPRYDSQSSLSISNPPSSPTQLSHDEFDDCGGSPPITTSAEDENMTFSEAKSMMPELNAGKVDAKIIPFSHSHGEDDEWAIADNEKMQEEEEEQHDEGPDSNQEDNEARESDAWELQMKNKPENFDVIIEKPREIVHASYGIESRVQSGASDQYSHDMDSQYHEMSIPNELHVFTDNSSGSLKSEEGKVLNDSSEIAEETAEEQEDVLFGIVTNTDHPTDSIKATKNSSQNPIAAVSRLPLPSTSSLCSVPASVTTSSDQNDVPAKLQFGLFSSPPLIPSPFPTIQIGSIQMPIPLNAQIDSYTHMPHAPIFQFGRMVYPASASQTFLPRAAHSLSYTNRPPLVHDRVNGNPGSSSKNQVSRDSTTTKGLDGGRPSSSADKQPVCATGITNPSRSNLDSEQATALLDVPRNDVLVSKQRMNSVVSDERKDFHNLISHSGNPDAISSKNFRPMVYSRRARGRPHIDSFSSARKSFAGPTASGIMPNIRGNRLTHNIRNASSLSSFTRLENSYVNSDRSQRRFRRHVQGTEYRVKESGGRQMQCTESLNYSSNSVKPNSGNNVSKKGDVVNKSTKLMNEEAALYGPRVVRADNNMNPDNKKEALQTGTSSIKFHGSEGNLNKNGLLEDAIDAPLLSGIVRVFNQPGIEASSDADGFVEVRSKRKISNERRGQRERETKLKHKATREPLRHRATLSNNGTGYKSDMFATLTGRAVAKSIHSDLASAHRRPSTDPEAAKLTTARRTSQTIAATSSPDVNSTDYDSKFSSLKSSGVGSDIAIANDGPNVEPSLSFGNNVIALDKASVPLGSRGTVHIGQQAVTPTQSQLDENSNSVQCNPVGAAKVPLDDKKLPTTSMTKEKSSFSSENLPNFLFDGEKIQFGAVVSPPPLPPSGQPPPTPIWSPSTVILNSSITHNFPVNDHLDDTEAEAEAAASAVAVSVITNDEMTASAKATSPISSVGTIRLSRPRVTSRVGTTGQSMNEEPLIVTLPADLSVDTPLPLWPPLPAVQSSRPMLSDIAGPHPSPFPFFDSNPMLGGPIFTYRPQDESAPAPQQQSPTFVSGPMGTWPLQCHSGVESSFYGSPAGFPGPFMSSPAGLSGVHGHPPPMVFYNHFAPMGQFGQLGLSYMGGGTYLPTGKQPDWKHCAEGNANGSKADPSSLNVVYGQQNGAQLPASIQHLSTGSGLLQVTSPFTLFNLPFQPSTEIPIPSQWPPIPHPHSSNPLRSLTTPPPEHLQNPPCSAAVNLPDELSLVESSSSIRSSSTADIKIGSNCIIPDSETAKADNSRGFSSQGYGRRNIFHGKYGSNNKYNKNIGSSSKVRQIYVAKSVLTTTTTSGASSG